MTDTTKRLEELCNILANHITSSDGNRQKSQPYIKSILLEFAKTIQLEAIDVAKYG